MNASAKFFEASTPVAFAGKDADNTLAFRWYDKDRLVHGRRLEDHLRFAVCYWHSFCWPGADPFGGETFLRPWHDGTDAMALARAKADVAFELFRLLDVPFFTFHDVDAAPEGASLSESVANLNAIADLFEAKMASAKVRLLWGTANLFTHRRYMAGAATNPDPDIFTYAAGQVRAALEVTHRLGGQNYVLWGGREGYETLLNTDLKRELDQLGRFVSLVVEHKHRIGFKGPILIEPKPKEPTKHQYDFDVATCYGFLERYDLLNDVKLNIEQNHAILAGHSFHHEVALAEALGVFGSLDVNRGDDLLGWDTDQFAMNVPELALVFHEILSHGGFTAGGLNFDAKIRRQSIDPDDLIHAHVGSMDACARAFLAAADMLDAGVLTTPLAKRYEGWAGPEGQAILGGQRSLADLADRALGPGFDPQPRSGRQEYLESLVNRHV
ncbi:xylose isomerase [Bradyrhizobium sp. 180]|uniref:xylose isomerase n=1 Tax=unclassified Bradyrhizobium TaxID=2631580 RepID=UPI001FF830A8|nr:xylose isomerase [Bradyrhizobium sp. CW12]MCK1493934.1 xylose isomerase [Bradyrhizobium sp. 180]MCK1532041.1 xylose isomerase [Bradyrhizobium sp. 182]MCK1595266.1 xylose isomerase [Bradyrhizobium sp. 164]MCK1618636.1 xylose isomerase [Bradyrhizobium sp. 159]MCK1644511.1 xylose isomerase [Bradyrhizobium sp. 154]MCK1665223.1 xylose isomerase [Bradyrhizobium sp. 153]MCK1756752.1 xylose isomerase [Bradyrhizobium sp. 137]